MRRTGIALLLLAIPAAARAEGTMPQMDFANPLTNTQILWMAVILVVLYLVLSRWGLPEIGQVLENRAAVIARDLAAAREAKAAADRAAAELNLNLKHAREAAQAQIAAAAAAAKAEAAAKAAALAAELHLKLAQAEARIDAGRMAALGAIKPVAMEAGAAMLERLTGEPAEPGRLAARVDDALARRAA